MIRISVSSTDIASIGFDSENKTLLVEFLGGGLYEYYGVERNVYQSFLRSSKHGEFYQSEIKNSYNGNKVA